MQSNDPLGARMNLTTGSGEVKIYSLRTLDEKVEGDVFSLPISVRVLLESLLRNCGGKFVKEKDVETLASWPESIGGELAYLPASERWYLADGPPATPQRERLKTGSRQIGD